MPSHVNAYRNEIADGLSREGSHQSYGKQLTYFEIAKQNIKPIGQANYLPIYGNGPQWMIILRPIIMAFLWLELAVGTKCVLLDCGVDIDILHSKKNCHFDRYSSVFFKEKSPFCVKYRFSGAPLEIFSGGFWQFFFQKYRFRYN